MTKLNTAEKEISYVSTNTYSTLNILSKKTKNVWFVCHGIGFLSKYFIKYFDELNREDNYIIAPQAQSKYYLKENFRHVGASWLTKENTQKETENVIHYFDAIFKSEQLPEDINLILVGYSQGVSVAMRYLAFSKINCSQLVLLSGGIPKELKFDDFKFLKENTKVTMVYGTSDEYLNKERIRYEEKRVYELFGNRVNIIPFDGVHEVKKDLIKDLV